MVDPSSEQKKALYDRLLADVNELFDLWWMNEELTERLFAELNFQPGGAERNFAPSKNQSNFGFTSFTQWQHSWYEDAELYFASQYLLAYHDALREIAATVDEEMPREHYEGELKDDLWAFVSSKLGKAWRCSKATDDAETRTHRWKVSAKLIFKQRPFGKDEDVNTFLHLLHRIAIVNDVLNHRGKRHGLTYTKRKEEGDNDVDPITAFCDRVKDIVKSFAQMNGKVISTNAKGVAGQYVFKVDDQHFCLMMNELRTNYDYYLNDYLEGKNAQGATQLSLVCPFIGHVLTLHIINTDQLQNTDLAPVLQQYYPGMKSAITKLSSRSGMPAEQKLFRMVKTLLEYYREQCITFLKSVGKSASH